MEKKQTKKYLKSETMEELWETMGNIQKTMGFSIRLLH